VRDFRELDCAAFSQYSSLALGRPGGVQALKSMLYRYVVRENLHRAYLPRHKHANTKTGAESEARQNCEVCTNVSKRVLERTELSIGQSVHWMELSYQTKT